MSIAIDPGPAIEEMRRFARMILPPPLRTIRQWAESEVRNPPSSDLKGQLFSVFTQPYVALLFAAIASGQWRRHVILGCVQSGKTYTCLVITALYHLFELKEDFIVGVPDMATANKKWKHDFLPVIQESRYKHLLPTKGDGARGGAIRHEVTFLNGRHLIFASGKGDDAHRSGFTARGVAITEVGKFVPLTTTKEAHPITQIQSRTEQFAGREAIYLESTVDVPGGWMWKDYQNGTASTIVRPCPHCLALVAPGREDLKGWQDADNEVDAKALAYWSCPACKAPWTEAERRAANLQGQLMHRGQRVEFDRIVGEPAKTFTLGFRWSAVDNHFWPAGHIGRKEWLARNAEDGDENNVKALTQFVYVLPWQGGETDLTTLTAAAIEKRANGRPRGVIPKGTAFVTVGVDFGAHLAHWSAIAWPSLAVVDYDIIEVPSAAMPIDKAILNACRRLDDRMRKGWADEDGEEIAPEEVWLDTGYQGKAGERPIYAFCQSKRTDSIHYRPIKGHGASQDMGGRYIGPTKAGALVVKVGNGWHESRTAKGNDRLIHIDADAWKSFVHSRLADAITEPDAMTLFEPPADNRRLHLTFAKHLTAEKQTQVWAEGKGYVITWKKKSNNNHYGDAVCYAAAAGNYAGFEILGQKPKEAPKEWFAQQKGRRSK